MMKLQIAIIKYSLSLLILIKLILQLLRQFLIYLMTKKSQFSLEPVEFNPNIFTINPTNPQQVLIKGTSLTYLSSGNTYDLSGTDLSFYN